MNKMTHRCKNITLSQSLFVGGKIYCCRYSVNELSRSVHTMTATAMVLLLICSYEVDFNGNGIVAVMNGFSANI